MASANRINANMVPFQYVEFYDVPRTLALRYKGKLLLLQSAFDHIQDEYPADYTVYLLPESVEGQLASGSWKFLSGETHLEALGQIPIKNVRFDPSSRKEIDASILDQFIF
jgi:hypothetical protein